ncbi:LacI family DNA-binding transcriptional regulator [Lactobacillus sp. PV037]|uniref:LacI family DNA-binding transcriptional regulator n=1 Tax=unclassified Lactobacillus TaxID=2620435 RepID=UPI00223FB3AC|nr:MULTISPECIES: LacI family DNA-binding transcriptional regulator [unclassified Lactobacillus]QNQ82418.1 LacI family DNA-binding transcriptional regulator [Lactobacillus sp. PV012]QNQ83469.1 LacI family DNA-binding transcriptional regulator [Lactobacillus sp. PV037]
MAVTIKDVAKRAGVSTSTASRALNNSSLISAATKQKVKQVAQILNYHTNYNARNLSLDETNLVGVVSESIAGDASANLFQMDLIQSISKSLNKRHYELVWLTGKNQDEILKRIAKNYNQFRIKNFIFLKDELSNEIVEFLNDNQINFLVIGHPEQKVRAINNDNILAGKAATEYLVKNKSSKNPLFFQSSKNQHFEQDRYLGYKDYLKSILKTPIRLTEKTDLEQFIKAHPEIDGIVCVDDALMIKELNHILKIDLPVITFNDSYLVGKLLKRWTFVDLKPEVLGQEAVEVLFNKKIENKVIDFSIKDRT